VGANETPRSPARGWAPLLTELEGFVERNRITLAVRRASGRAAGRRVDTDDLSEAVHQRSTRVTRAQRGANLNQAGEQLVRCNARHELELLTVGIWLALAVAAPSASSVSSGGTSNRGSTASMRTIRSRCAAAALRASSS
jgi:hypothetical protein